MKKLFTILFSLLFVTSNLLAQWESIGSGISGDDKEYFSLSVIDENIIWATPYNRVFSPNYEFTKTIDGGITWTEGSLPDTIGNYYPTNIFALDANTAWIVMVSIPTQASTKIFNTIDGGNTWKEQTGLFNQDGYAIPTIHFFNENDGLAFGSPGTNNTAIDSIRIFKTNDGGMNWNKLSTGALPEPVPEEAVWVYSGNSSYEVKGDTLWFGTRASRVFRSIDKGETWEAFDVGISGTNNSPGLSSIAFEDHMKGIAVTYQPNKAARTTDGGETWIEIDIPSSPRLGGIEYIPGTEDTYLINDGYQSSSWLLLTTDGGETWESVVHLPTMKCMQFLSPTIGFGGGIIKPNDDLGIFKWTGDLSDLMSTNTIDLEDASEVVNLYPNPTLNNLTINFNTDIFRTDKISIEVLSLDGKLIKNQTYPFSRAINISTAEFPKGFYSLRISDQKKTIIKKFVKH